jgi:hypothetical protein
MPEQRQDRAGLDDSPDPMGDGGLHHVQSAEDVDAERLDRIVADHRAIDQSIGPGRCPHDGTGVGDVNRRHFVRRRVGRRHRGAGRLRRRGQDSLPRADVGQPHHMVVCKRGGGHRAKRPACSEDGDAPHRPRRGRLRRAIGR